MPPLMRRTTAAGSWFGFFALVLVAIAGAAWWYRRRQGHSLRNFHQLSSSTGLRLSTDDDGPPADVFIRNNLSTDSLPAHAAHDVPVLSEDASDAAAALQPDRGYASYTDDVDGSRRSWEPRRELSGGGSERGSGSGRGSASPAARDRTYDTAKSTPRDDSADPLGAVDTVGAVDPGSGESRGASASGTPRPASRQSGDDPNSVFKLDDDDD